MLEYFAGNWGGWVSALGVLVSSAGLGWAIIAARRARSASQAAQEARSYIARHLQAVDLERAIALIQRIKDLHNDGRWQTAMEQYQSLRYMLSNIVARCPDGQAELRDALTAGRAAITAMENLVRELIVTGIGESEQARLNQELNQIQSDLEQLSSAISFGDEPGGAR